MSVNVKVIIDAAEYDRLIAIEKSYLHMRKENHSASQERQGGSGKNIDNVCTCEQGNSKETPP